MSKTRIVCTMGPASDSEEVIVKMIESGVVRDIIHSTRRVRLLTDLITITENL